MIFEHLEVLCYHVAAQMAAATIYNGGPPPHVFHSFKSIDAVTGDVPQLEAPFVMVRDARQMGPTGHVARQFSGPLPTKERTRCGIWIVSPITFSDDGVQGGGFDLIHRPLFNYLRDWIQGEQALDIPTVMQPTWRSGTVGVLRDTLTGEDHSRLPEKKWEQSVIYTVLYEYKAGGHF